ncbi:MAG TPA: hypothetical protein DCS29_01005 [Candidatus Magasanikbacteria bacterium]|nr:MAG: hypothetical protein A2479_04630 [Candidatus Magasanikbacteria bacterium RIFOXYC2_FULL_39_8]HAT03342.1 hypothetical protein [Candidatus Magasanikbacteria bacterium]
MSDVLKFGKKLFTFSVVAVTIVWSMGLAALVPAAAYAVDTCPELEAGELFKVPNGSAVYMLTSDLDAMYFPSEEIFKSWNLSFTNVTQIPNSCFDNYEQANPAGVNYRPGTYLLKRVESPSIYVVLPGNQRQKVTEPAVLEALYGSNWGTLVRDVPSYYWSNYVAAATDLTTAVPHDGMVVRKTGETKVYYVKGSTLYEVTGLQAAGMTDFGGVKGYEVASLGGLTVAATTVTLNSIYEDPTQVSNMSSVVSGGDVTVSLAANTPAAADVLTDSTANEYPQGNIGFTSVNFKAGSEAAVVKTVKFTRTGIANDADLGSLYLYEGTTKLAEYNSFNDKVVTFTNNSGLFTVAAGQTKTITLRGDLARGSTSVSGGKKIGFDIVSVDHVALNGGTVSGTFPATGNQMTTVAVADLGHVYVDGYTTFPATVKADEANKELWRMTMHADSQDMEVRYVKLTMVGTIDTDDVTNLRLESNGVQVGTTMGLSSEKTVVFDLANSAIKIPAGQSRVVVLRGDMAGGSGRSMKWSIQRISDIVSYDTEYNVTVSVAKDALTTAFSLIEPETGDGTNVSAGTLTVGLASESPTGNIPDAGTNVEFANFTFEAAGEAVKVDNLSVTCNGTGSNEVLANVKLLLNGTQVGTTDTSLTCNNSQTADYTFGNTFVVPAGTTVSNLKVVADTTGANIASGDNLSVSLVVGTANAQGQTTMTTLATTAETGRTLAVKSGTVSVAENSSFSDKTATNPTGTVNAKEAQIASFTITAGSAEAADVTQITLADNATTGMASNYQNLKIKHDGVQIGSTVSSLNSSASTYTFTPSTAIRIAAGQQYVVDVYADIKSSAADAGEVAYAPIRYAANAITATGVLTNASANSSNSVTDLQNHYISANGNLTVTVDGNTAPALQLVLGSTQQELGTFKLEADAAEDINVTDLVVSVSTTATQQGTLKNLTLYKDGVAFGPAVNLPIGAASTGTYWNATFSGLDLTIPRGKNVLLTVKADVTTFDLGGTSGGSYYTAMVYNIGSALEPVTSVGKSSGASITGASLDIGAATDANIVANEMMTYRTKLSVAFANDTPSGSATGGTDSIVAKFVVSNSTNVGSYSATLENFNLAIGNTGVSATAARTLDVYKTSVSTANLLATTNWGTAHMNIGDTSIAEASFNSGNGVSISAGGSLTLIVQLDTNDAGNDDKLSFNLAANDVEWSDGSATSITEVDGLPLTAKTLTF